MTIEPMIDHLAASGPDPAHRDEMGLFGRLIGSWEITMTATDDEGGRRDYTAEWHFGWVIGGRGVQDVLITRAADREVVGYGTTMRTFDPRSGTWRVVWQDPLAGEFAVLIARAEDDRIVLDGQWIPSGPTKSFRWTFSKITDDSFRWECHVIQDDGEWRLAEEMWAERATDPR
jgi:hypothetical protein